ncbi:CIC11C00000003204 [Sungouiella intermedia]|uniref:CIC11C00000003204 n=1 Tax=Sungouiella intermedia TaxID=45354 RepID=A0A1L0BKV2_9ASCO|nr:CIC11C00000003204 [[Candida] intermedia]
MRDFTSIFLLHGHLTLSAIQLEKIDTAIANYHETTRIRLDDRSNPKSQMRPGCKNMQTESHSEHGAAHPEPSPIGGDREIAQEHNLVKKVEPP